MTTILIKDIQIDEEIYPRQSINETTVERYACWLAGLPPIEVWQIEGRKGWWLVDGWHRLKATESTGGDEIAIMKGNGTADEAKERSFDANMQHGLPLTLPERKDAARLKLRLHPDHSDRMIAEQCGVSHPTVGTLRAELESGGKIYHVSEVTGQDGKTYDRPKEANRRKTKVAEPVAEPVAESADEPRRPKAGGLAQRSSLSEPALAFDAGRPDYLTGPKAQVAANCADELQRFAEATVRLAQYADYFGCYHGQGQEALDKIMEATNMLKAILPRAATKKGS